MCSVQILGNKHVPYRAHLKLTLSHCYSVHTVKQIMKVLGITTPFIIGKFSLRGIYIYTRWQWYYREGFHCWGNMLWKFHCTAAGAVHCTISGDLMTEFSTVEWNTTSMTHICREQKVCDHAQASTFSQRHNNVSHITYVRILLGQCQHKCVYCMYTHLCQSLRG